MIYEPQVICIAENWAMAQWLHRAIYNTCGGLETRLATYERKDTDFSYQLISEKKLRKADHEQAQLVARGLVYGWRAFSH